MQQAGVFIVNTFTTSSRKNSGEQMLNKCSVSEHRLDSDRWLIVHDVCCLLSVSLVLLTFGLVKQRKVVSFVIFYCYSLLVPEPESKTQTTMRGTGRFTQKFRQGQNR